NLRCTSPAIAATREPHPEQRTTTSTCSPSLGYPHAGQRKIITELKMFRHILIATDGSELAKKAEAQGLALAKELKAAATAVTVTESWSALEAANQAERGAMHPIQDYERNMAALAERILS